MAGYQRDHHAHHRLSISTSLSSQESVGLMLIFDFFSGTGSSTQAFADAGDTVITFELDSQFDATETIDILHLTSEYLLKTYGRPDFIWSSPPCTAFSVASIGHHWQSGGGISCA
jgi:hypothetical protein